MAAMSSGPPNADATIHRMTNQDPCGGVAAAVVRAVPHTIASTGSSGITPSSRATDRHRDLMHAQPHAGDRTECAGHVAVRDEQLQQHHRGDDDQRDHRRAERNPEQVTSLASADRPVLHH